MHGILLKETQAVDFISPLMAYIQDNFSQVEKDELEPALKKLRQQRERFMQAMNKQCETYEKAIDFINGWLSCLLGLEQKFPFGSHEQGSMFSKKKTTTVMVSTNWSDSFRPHKKFSSCDIQFEKCNVIFSIGSILSSVAAKQERGDVEGVQKAAKLFQQAAGVFSYLASKLALPPNPNMIDVTSHSLKLLSQLMVAQASACSLEHAVIKQMKPAIKAMLAYGAYELFTKTEELGDANEDLKTWLSKSDYDWRKFFTYQKLMFEAAAQYWQSVKDVEDYRHGQVITRLQYADELIKKAVKVERSQPAFAAGRKRLHEIVLNALAAAIKDNDTIYHFAIPRVEDLPAIPSKVVTKAAPFELPEPFSHPAFAKLVPVHVQKAIEKFKSQLTDEAQQIMATCHDSSDIVNEALSELNLPAALDALEPEAGLNKKMWKQIKGTQTSGGAEGLQKIQEQTLKAAKEASKIYTEIRQALIKEQEEDQKFRNQYGARWDRSASHDITESYITDLKNVAGYLESARTADGKVAEELEKNIDGLAKLSQTRDEIERSLPSIDQSGKTEASEAVRSCLDKLTDLLKARDVLVEKFILEIDAYDPSSLIMAQIGVKSVDEIFSQESQKIFNVHRQAIDANLAKQSELFDELTAANQKFVASRSSDPARDQRQLILQDLNRAVEKYNKLLANLNEGKKFYKDIIKDFLKPLHDNVLGFVAAREHEARMLLEEISRNYVDTSISSRLPEAPTYGDDDEPSAPPPY